MMVAGERGPVARGLERRTMLRMAGVAMVAPWVPGGAAGAASAAQGRGRPSPGTAAAAVDPALSLARAFEFLDERTSLAPGTEGFLPRSYTGGYLGSIGFDVAFVYDCALVVLAHLARGTVDDVARATRIGDVLVTAQLTDPAGDGRLRTSYMTSPAVGPRGPDVAGAATMTGNQAWAGIAFVRLYERTGAPRFLEAALRTAAFVASTAFDERGVGGFSGGSTADGAPLTWRSTEHNTDCVAFFGQLGRVTGDGPWTQHAERARVFVRSMWQGTHFHIGTLLDGVTPNTSPIVEDVQTWTYLALRETAYASSLDFAWTKLVTTDGPVTGARVVVTTQKKVWLEGTAHLACALATRGATGDATRAATLRTGIWTAQTTVPNADGRGIPAASSDGLTTGEGDVFYTSLHTGATAWAVFAALGVNPLA